MIVSDEKGGFAADRVHRMLVLFAAVAVMFTGTGFAQAAASAPPTAATTQASSDVPEAPVPQVDPKAAAASQTDAPPAATASQQNAAANSAGGSSSSSPAATATVPALPAAPSPKPASASITLFGTPKRMLLDQKAIWTSPLRLRPLDAEWLLPLGVATGFLIGSDQHTINALVRTNTLAQNRADTLSNASIVGLGAIPALGYFWSLEHWAPQAHETGLLAGEALGDSLIFAEAAKFVSRRDRPYVNNAKGNFFSSSFTGSSFPSNHANAAWSIAAVVADEYPGWLSRTAVYGMAATVSASRILAHKHFPSDVLVGSASGWLIGHYVYRAHHNYELDPTNPAPLPEGDPNSAANRLAAAAADLPPDPIVHRPAYVPPMDTDPDKYGSTNVPMDSWVYPALERLAALGLIPGQSVSIRPWTRQECRRQLSLAEDQLDLGSPGLHAEAERLIGDLRQELNSEAPAAQTLTLEWVYSRIGTIAGPALQDSYHFGQTWWNDFGRPLGRGTSAINGFSVRATNQRLFFYTREETQHGPGNPAQTAAQNQLFNQLDTIPNYGDPVIQPIAGYSAYDRYRPLELYAGVAFEGNAISLGKQELYWGPTTMGPLAFSSNAEPTYSLRAVSTRPHPLPLFLSSLGTYRFDIVLGKLSGHKYPERPWYNGQKADFNFGDNLEISFTRWSVFWGVGHPITLHSFKKNIFSFTSTGNSPVPGVGSESGHYGDRTDPGDRKSNFDFHWRLPFMQRLVTLYADAYSDDDPNPIDAPRRAVWNPGIYFARLPYLPHMDLRVEAVSSTGLATDFGGEHFFWNNQYLDSNTNKGFMLGNAIGRDSRAIEGRSGYWFSARSRVELGYRQNKTGTNFLPGGGTITDGFMNTTYAISPHWQAQAFAQSERFLIPSYLPGAHHNTSGWLQITWNPQLSLRK